MHNHIPCDLLSTDERLEELASILAGGIRRLRIRKNRMTDGETEQVFVDFSPEGSSHVLDQNRKKERTWQDQ